MVLDARPEARLSSKPNIYFSGRLHRGVVEFPRVLGRNLPNTSFPFSLFQVFFFFLVFKASLLGLSTIADQRKPSKSETLGKICFAGLHAAGAIGFAWRLHNFLLTVAAAESPGR